MQTDSRAINICMLTSLEMRFMWFKRLSPLKALFFFNRYLTAAILVCVLCFSHRVMHN
jgi:hypothetical protein